MDVLNSQTIDGLNNALTSLLPPVAAPIQQLSLLINPARIAPIGVGGVVGLQREPFGEIVGRRLEARAAVAVRAANLSDLDTALAAVSGALMGAGRTTLAGLGIQRLTLDDIGPRPQESGPPGPSLPVERELVFSVHYEFLKAPEEAGGVIEQIPLDLEVSRSSAPRSLLNINFRADPLARFEIVDDPAAGTAAPSDWQYNSAEAGIEQRSLIRGGSDAADPNKPGTYLLLRPHPLLPPVRDFILRTSLKSADGGIGVVFRWRDPDNFYFFIMDRLQNYRLMGKKVAGTFQDLDTAALDDTEGYEAGQLYEVKLTAQGGALRAYLDGEEIVNGQDASLADAGRVGFLCRNNDQASFYRIGLVRL